MSVRGMLSGWIVTVCSVAVVSAQEQTWPQFLGPSRNGVSSEQGLLKTWPADGPREAWRVAGGVGMSAVSVRDGRAITLVQREGQQVVIALDAEKGSSLWATPVAPAFENPQGDGPRGTPALTPDAVFVYTGEGTLTALRPTTGERLWQYQAVESLGGQPADYGMACSPLVVGQTVVVITGAPDAAVVACDVKTGQPVWKSARGAAGYSSPVVLKVDGQDQLVAFLGESAVGLDPASGKQLWEYPYVTDFQCNIATPLSVDGNVFLSAGENHGSVLLSLKDPSKPRELWASQGARSVLRNEWQTSVLLDGYLYGFDNVGSAGPVTHLTCVEARSGKRMWQQLRFGKGNLIAADGKLFMTTMQGDLVIANASPKAYQELGRKTVLETTRQAPSLAGGRLYLRDDAEIVCLDVRQAKP